MGMTVKSLGTLRALAHAQYLAESGKLSRIQQALAEIDRQIRDASSEPLAGTSDDLWAAGERSRWQDSQRRQLREARKNLEPKFDTARDATSRSLGRVQALENLAEKAQLEARRHEERADEVWVTLLSNLKRPKS